MKKTFLAFLTLMASAIVASSCTGTGTEPGALSPYPEIRFINNTPETKYFKYHHDGEDCDNVPWVSVPPYTTTAYRECVIDANYHIFYDNDEDHRDHRDLTKCGDGTTFWGGMTFTVIAATDSGPYWFIEEEPVVNRFISDQ